MKQPNDPNQRRQVTLTSHSYLSSVRCHAVLASWQPHYFKLDTDHLLEGVIRFVSKIVWLLE
ncbi:MAG: hypothetical protein ACP5RH_18965 [Leptodesmis sp.]